MSRHRVFKSVSLFSVLVTFTFASVPAVVRAQAAAAGGASVEIENSKFQAEGQINAATAYIRSGMGDNDYSTMKLDRGTVLTVVGGRGDWLKIAPPSGSYCYFAKAYVERRGDGTVGRVTNEGNARVGSALNAMKSKIGVRLNVGDDVKILGEQDEYFKIAPPPGVYLYINKQYVELLRTINPAETNKLKVADAGIGTPDSATSAQPREIAAMAPAGLSADVPATQPSADEVAIATPSATQPSEAQLEAESQFDALERTFVENDRKPLEQQPLAELQSGYEKLAASQNLPESLRRLTDYRVQLVKQRLDDQQRYVAVKKNQDEMRQKQLALQAEREELEQRIKASGVHYYTAVGSLRPSSLQQGSGMLYRLTDPNTGRTLIYIRNDDAKLAALVGQFIGVTGEIQKDKSLNLQTIEPTAFETVDQSKVNLTVAAQIIPPSLLPTGSQATTGNE